MYFDIFMALNYERKMFLGQEFSYFEINRFQLKENEIFFNKTMLFHYLVVGTGDIFQSIELEVN